MKIQPLKAWLKNSKNTLISNDGFDSTQEVFNENGNEMLLDIEQAGAEVWLEDKSTIHIIFPDDTSLWGNIFAIASEIIRYNADVEWNQKTLKITI